MITPVQKMLILSIGKKQFKKKNYLKKNPLTKYLILFQQNKHEGVLSIKITKKIRDVILERSKSQQKSR